MITAARKKIYLFINEFINQHHYSPSYADIAKGVGLSTNSKSLISRQVHALVEAGWLATHDEGYRCLKNFNDKKDATAIPLLGRIAAGSPIEAMQGEEILCFAELLKGNCLLEVKGDSMIDEGIFDKDLIIFRPTSMANEGDIGIALIDDQHATLKRISYKSAGKITLIPANSNLKPMMYDTARIKIQGVYIGLLRLRS